MLVSLCRRTQQPRAHHIVNLLDSLAEGSFLRVASLLGEASQFACEYVLGCGGRGSDRRHPRSLHGQAIAAGQVIGCSQLARRCRASPPQTGHCCRHILGRLRAGATGSLGAASNTPPNQTIVEARGRCPNTHRRPRCSASRAATLASAIRVFVRWVARLSPRSRPWLSSRLRQQSAKRLSAVEILDFGSRPRLPGRDHRVEPAALPRPAIHAQPKQATSPSV